MWMSLIAIYLEVLWEAVRMIQDLMRKLIMTVTIASHMAITEYGMGIIRSI